MNDKLGFNCAVIYPALMEEHYCQMTNDDDMKKLCNLK